MIGQVLGPYQVLSKLGEGGMGEVYRAKDTNLDRDVAIKVLPESFALDADRVARFTREARTLAALNHPNIAAIYGLERTGDATALVMELVEGDDLSVHIARGPIPIAEALPIARRTRPAVWTSTYVRFPVPAAPGGSPREAAASPAGRPPRPSCCL